MMTVCLHAHFESVLTELYLLFCCDITMIVKLTVYCVITTELDIRLKQIYNRLTFSKQILAYQVGGTVYVLIRGHPELVF